MMLQDSPSVSGPIPWTTADLLAATGGDLLSGDMRQFFGDISIDSRSIAAGSLFVAIRGQVHDGHRFIPQALAAGVRGIIVDGSMRETLALDILKKQGVVVIAVKNTTRALGDLAGFNRKRAGISVVAITGSNGKTSTKEMTAAVVAQRFRALATSGNLNNEIGLPLTLLKLEPRHQWAVLELGMNHAGEIRRLAEICRPDVGIITNIGRAHLEGLGSLDGVMRAKGELLEKINPGGRAVLNADDPRVMELAKKTDLAVTFFGFSEDAAVRALAVKSTAATVSFRLILPAEEINITLAAAGRFMVYNALAAAGVGLTLGFSAAEIKTGLESFKAVGGRMNIIQTRKNVSVVDDTYNANPASMQAAIAALGELKGNKRGILVIGDMLELGHGSETLHREIGAFSARAHTDRLYLTGDYAEAVKAGALEGGTDAGTIFSGTHAEILADLTGRLKTGDWVLVKGSRGMAMEKIVIGLKVWGDTQ
ncbi:MAG: UDP-N-acetylmuramoyl-tripeptide--D-alanyl-D-alanine ligase [Desulfobacterales bacterium]|nr:UDP-N-acetylmuramoyl-tripeptide--D-alanyl-D-alanine ligase [Desulfobacterales bacterium]